MVVFGLERTLVDDGILHENLNLRHTAGWRFRVVPDADFGDRHGVVEQHK